MDRDDANLILEFIGAESLTDEEWESMDLDEESNDLDMYNALSAVLAEREDVTDMQARLNYYYAAQGISFTEAEGSSNIFVGSEL